MQRALDYTLHASWLTVMQLGLTLGPLAVLGTLAHFASESVRRRASAIFGYRGYLYLGGALGTVVHEGSHVLLCLVFRHRIAHIKWFDAAARDGALGSVMHQFDPRNPYQRIGNFFIGVAPIAGATAIITLAASLLLGVKPSLDLLSGGLSAASLSAPNLTTSALVGAGDGVRAYAEALAASPFLLSWRGGLFAYLCLSIGGAMALSPADLRGAADGLFVTVIVVLAVNLLTGWTRSTSDAVPHAVTAATSVLVSSLTAGVVLNSLAAVALRLIPIRLLR